VVTDEHITDITKEHTLFSETQFDDFSHELKKEFKKHKRSKQINEIFEEARINANANHALAFIERQKEVTKNMKYKTLDRHFQEQQRNTNQ